MPPTVIDVLAPRICHVPDYGYSSGQDAIELAESAGLVLDPWQQFILRHALGERADGKWAAFQVALIVARQQGKGSILEALELAALFLFGERLILHSAHEYKTAMEAFLRVRSLIENTDDLRRQVKRIINTNGEEGIELLSGQRLRFIARSKGAGRGFSVDRLIWDEAYALTAEQVDAQLPVLSARPNGQVWYTSSPPLDAVTGAQLFRLRRMVLAGEATSTAFFDYGVDGTLDDLAEVDLDDRALWAASNPALGCGRISMEAIEREREAMGSQGFARERLGIWPPDLSAGFTVISDKQWADAKADAHGGTHVAPAFAVSVSPRNGGPVRATVSAAMRMADGSVQVEVIETGSGTAWVIPSLTRLIGAWKPCAVVIDPGSPAGSLIAEADAAGLEITTMQSRDVAQAFGQFYDGVTGKDEGARVVHLGQSELTLAVAGAGKRPVGDGHAWDSRQATTDITPLISCTNALWGLLKLGHVQSPEPMVMWL